MVNNKAEKGVPVPFWFDNRSNSAREQREPKRSKGAQDAPNINLFPIAINNDLATGT